VHTDPTMRSAKGVDTRDNHFAVRVPSYRQALEFLRRGPRCAQVTGFTAKDESSGDALGAFEIRG